MNFETKYLKDGLVGKANATYRPGAGDRNQGRESVIGTVTRHGLGDTGVLSPVRVKILVSSKPVHTSSWNHPASSTMVTGTPFPGDKAARARRWTPT